MVASDVKKIVFEGAICTGKTTMLDHYQGRFLTDPMVAFVNEAGREYLQLNPHLDYQASVDVSEGIQSLALAKERAAHETGAQLIFCDRSVLSAVVYERANGNPQKSVKLLRRIEQWLPTYTQIVLFDPTDIPYSHDAIRRGDADQRKRYHDIFVETFNELQIPYLMISGTVEERARIIDNMLL